MAGKNAGDAAVIVVRMDVEGAKRDLAALNAQGQKAANTLSTTAGGAGGGGGGGGGGGAKGGARTGPAVGGAGGAKGRRGGMGLGGLAAAGARSVGAVGGVVGGAMILGADMGLADVVGGVTNTVGARIAQMGRIMQMRQPGAEYGSIGYAGADARAGLHSLDQTKQAFAYAVGAGFMAREDARPFFDFIKQERQKVERGNILLGEHFGEELAEETKANTPAMMGEFVKAIDKLGDRIIQAISPG